MTNRKTLWRRKVRQRLIKSLGGKCVRCGTKYDLHFHHFIPSLKSISMNKAIRTNYHVAKHEAKKCVLLCGNCHRKEHGWN